MPINQNHLDVGTAAPITPLTAEQMEELREIGRMRPHGWQVISHAAWTGRLNPAATEADCPYPAAGSEAERIARERWIWMFRMRARAEDKKAWENEKQCRAGLR